LGDRMIKIIEKARIRRKSWCEDIERSLLETNEVVPFV